MARNPWMAAVLVLMITAVPVVAQSGETPGVPQPKKNVGHVWVIPIPLPDPGEDEVKALPEPLPLPDPAKGKPAGDNVKALPEPLPLPEPGQAQ